MVKRTKKNKFCDYILIPTIRGSINGSFLEKLMYNVLFDYDIKNIELRLKLFYLTKQMFKLLQDNNDKNLLDEFVDLWNYYNEMWGLDLLNEIGSFIGCSSGHKYIHNILNDKLMNSDSGYHEQEIIKK